jgi:hypothetical protein
MKNGSSQKESNKKTSLKFFLTLPRKGYRSFWNLERAVEFSRLVKEYGLQNITPDYNAIAGKLSSMSKEKISAPRCQVFSNELRRATEDAASRNQTLYLEDYFTAGRPFKPGNRIVSTEEPKKPKKS